MKAQDRQARIDAFRNRCRSSGIPFTVQRRTTYQVLLDRTDHPTADQIYVEVRQELPDVSRMTVYRVLDLLVDLGLVRKVCHPGNAVRFDANLTKHHHLVCLRCDKLIDFEETAFDDLKPPRAARRLGFRVDGYFVQFRGLCAACREEEAGSGSES
jgi:Fur family peroxide stress response transcriptional regulator